MTVDAAPIPNSSALRPTHPIRNPTGNTPLARRRRATVKNLVDQHLHLHYSINRNHIRLTLLLCWLFFLPCFQDPIHSGGAMEASVFLSSAVLVLVTVVLLLPSRIVSFVLLRFTTKQRVTILGSEVYYDSDSNSSNGRSTELLQVPDLLLDIVIDILSRLPVETLIRFKCASKQWNQLISGSPYFVSMHLIRNKQSANNFILCTYNGRSNDGDAYDNEIQSVILSSSDDDPPLVDSVHHPVVASSGDLGVLLLRWTDRMPSLHQSESEYALLNPATRQVNHLFRPPLEPPSRTTFFPDYPDEDDDDDDPDAPRLRQYNDDCGVGLDMVSNLVKVVLVRNYAFLRQRTECSDTRIIQPVYVYELGLAGGWRKLTADYPFHPQGGARLPTNLCNSTYFKGSIYWFSYEFYGETLLIVTFDLGTEVFRNVDCPIYGHDDHRTIMGPYIYRDSIAVFASDISSVDIWLLSGTNEGVGELCWIKHSNIAPLPLELHFCAIFTDDKLVALSPYDEDRKHDLVVFDTRKQQVKVVIPDLLLYELFTYRESLVCVQ
ncbi:F-box protein At2g40910 [Linum grandiflorum]